MNTSVRAIREYGCFVRLGTDVRNQAAREGRPRSRRCPPPEPATPDPGVRPGIFDVLYGFDR